MISHVAALLADSTSPRDCVARWSGDEFIVGCIQRSLRVVMERIVKAVDSSPCEIGPGLELRVTVSCGVADYRFGSGPMGVIADADRAMFAAKELSRAKPGASHVCYRSEMSEVMAPRPDAVAAD